jgi:pimeloyl-ACP methyl ester carboxylesterase
VTWLLALVGIAVLYQGAVLVAMLVAWRNARVPPRRTPAVLGIAYEEIWIPTANAKRLHGWWIPGGGGRRPAVVLVHGWNRNAERMLPYVEALRPAGYHLLAFDARHHGASDLDGHASMKKFSEDIRAAVAYLAARPDVDVHRLGVVGLSIGGSAAIHAAAHEHRIRAVVTVGSFAHPRDAMLQAGLGALLLAPAMPLVFRVIEWRVGARFDQLAPEHHASRIAGRLLLIHGEQDTVVPVENLERLHRAAGGRAEAWRIAGRGHSDPHLEPGFADRLTRFLSATFEES